jgi:hypothetical protein
LVFTGERAIQQTNLAITVLKYFAFVHLVARVPLIAEPWIEKGVHKMLITVGVIGGVHLLPRTRHRRILREQCNMPGLQEGAGRHSG